MAWDNQAMAQLRTHIRRLKHPGWWWVWTILLVVVATYPANTVRLISLFFAWVVGTITFHHTKFSAKRASKTILASIVLFVVFGSIFWGSYSPDELRDSGLLRPLRTLFSFNKDVVPALEIGDSGVILSPGAKLGTGYDLNELKPFLEGSGLTINKTIGWKFLSLTLVPDRLAVSMTIRDDHGKPVAELIGNEWQTAHKPVAWDRNYNDNSLEVEDETGDVVLQITVLSNKIRFQGKWYRNNGDRAYLIQSNGIRRPRNYALMAFDSPGKRFGRGNPEFTIRPMFKYPSDRHPHELDVAH
jgi:energy-coupling factor transporter transmembrane protein EcfT